MICVPCREGHHLLCPEVSRQLDPHLSDIDRLGGAHCYCAHDTSVETCLRQDRGPDPRRGA